MMATRPPSETSRDRPLAVGLVQLAMSADTGDNLARAVAGVREAARKGAKVVVLPELFRSRYFCQSEDHRFFDLAEPIPGPSTTALGALAAELGVVVVALKDHRERRSLVVASLAAVVLVVFQAWLGRETVRLNNSGASVTAHLSYTTPWDTIPTRCAGRRSSGQDWARCC